MARITAFNWDNLQITKDEDPAYAGDKEPNSKDDVPCGDGFISNDKDCHDGDAHRPAPGDNPYWTDENSAEERNDRDADWDDNKPAPAAEEEQPVSEEAIEAVPRDQWDKNTGNIRNSLIALSTLFGNIDISSPRFQEIFDGLEPLKSDERTEHLSAVQTLQSAINDAEEFLSGTGRSRLENPEFFDLEVKKAQFAIDMLNGSIEPRDPRDIQVWDKLMNRPETLEVEDLLQLSNLRKADLNNLKPEEEKYAQREITKLASTLAKWREQPTLGGAYLAAYFVDPPERLGWSKDGLIQESPFENNPQLALAILDRSARAGDRQANNALWDQFGLSEEWHPTSFLHDEQKAIDKGTNEMEQMADWSGIKSAQKEMMVAGMGLAEAEDALEEYRPTRDAMVDALLEERDAGKLDSKTFIKRTSEIQDTIDPYVDGVWNARKKINDASRKIMAEAEKIREPIKNALRQLNQYNRVDPDIEGTLLHKAGNALWADLDENDEDYKARPNQGRAGLSGARLLTMRKKARENESSYPNKDSIVENLQDFISICHGDLLGASELQSMDWTSEVFERAYANPNDNSICLSVSPINIPKGTVYDRSRSMAKEPLDRPDVAIHEFAHHIEFRNQDIAKRMENFYKRRTEGQPIIRKGDKKPDGTGYPSLGHYDEDESFKDDHFFDMYCGKYYGDSETREAMGTGGTQTSELVSMGMQALYNKAQWGLMIRDDPQHLALIIAALRGY